MRKYLLIFITTLTPQGAFAQTSPELLVIDNSKEIEQKKKNLAQLEKLKETQKMLKEMIAQAPKNMQKLEQNTFGEKSPLEQFLNPKALKILKVLENEKFLKGLKLMSNRKKLIHLAIAQIILLILIFTLRAWRNNKTKTVLGSVWISIWTNTLYIGIASVGLPYLIFGSSFFEVVKEGKYIFESLVGN